jgi:drug/metabolite transporter (DMT)-like permease
VTRTRRFLPWFALAVVYLVWGSTYLGIRVAVTTIPPYFMTGFRYFVAGGLLLILQRVFSKQPLRWPPKAEWPRIALVATLLLVVGNGLLCVAETRVESGTSALLLASTPIWMVLFDALRTRRAPRPVAIAGMLLGSAGIAALVGRGTGNVDTRFALIIMVASLSWALGSMYAQTQDRSPTAAALEMIFGGALCVAVGLGAGESAHFNVAAVTPASMWGMLWLITGGAMVGYTAFTYAVQTLPTTTVATYGYVNPVVAVILGATLLREPVTWNVLLGGAGVIVSVVLILVGSRTTANEIAAEPS